MAALFLLVFFLYFCSMKHTSILLAMVLLCGVLSAQPVKISKKHNALVYNVYQYGDTKDTTKVYLYQVGNEKLKMKSIAGEDAYWIESELPQGTLDGRKILDRVREQQIMKMVEERKRKMKQQKPAASVKESEDSK